MTESSLAHAQSALHLSILFSVLSPLPQMAHGRNTAPHARSTRFYDVPDPDGANEVKRRRSAVSIAPAKISRMFRAVKGGSIASGAPGSFQSPGPGAKSVNSGTVKILRVFAEGCPPSSKMSKQLQQILSTRTDTFTILLQ